MPKIIEITDFSAEQLDIYARLTEPQLLHGYLRLLIYRSKPAGTGNSRAALHPDPAG